MNYSFELLYLGDDVKNTNLSLPKQEARIVFGLFVYTMLKAFGLMVVFGIIYPINPPSDDSIAGRSKSRCSFPQYTHFLHPFGS
jgi:hypothetical protein